MTVQAGVETQGRAAGEGDDADITLDDVVKAVTQGWRLLVFGSLGAGLLALAVSFLIPPTFVARAVILPPQQQSAGSAALAQLGALAGAAGAAVGIKNPADQYVGILKSQTVADRLIDRFGLLTVYEKEFKQDARKALSGASQFQAGKDGLISIEVGDKSPQRAADLANAYIEELERLLDQLALGEAKQRRIFFESQLKETHDRLTQAQVALQATGVGAETLKLSPQSAVESVARMKAQIMAQEVRIASMRGYLSEQSSDIQQATRELAALREQLRRVESSDPKGGKDDDGYLSRYRDFKYQETLFEMLARQFEMAKADEAREGVLLQVVDRASPPDRKAKPKRGLIAVSVTAVVFIGLMAFLMYRNRRESKV